MLLGSWLAAGSCLGADGHRSALVVDVADATVLHAHAANRPLPPASLTKLMTIFLLLEAIADSEIKPSTRFEVSSNASHQPPSRFGFKTGEKVDVATLLAALVVVSGNDAAVIAAEGLAGSEERFVERMNEAARRLGMRRTRFRNASGLPADGQRSTATDLAILARTLQLRFEGDRELFALREVGFNGRRQQTINRFLGSYRGADGMKTGFTCRAGFNLVASVHRDDRHLIGVVMGASSRGQRASGMRRMMDDALAGRSNAHAGVSLSALGASEDQGAALPLPTDLRADTCLNPGASARRPVGWSIDIGVERTAGKAIQRARRFIRKHRRALGGGARAIQIPRFTGINLYRALVTGLKQERARDTCLAYRNSGGDCVIMNQDVATTQLEHARRIARLNKAVRLRPANRK